MLVSFGDGGNELGWDRIRWQWFFDNPQIKRPISKAKNLVPASVSNYGVYAVIKELEWATDRTLLPNPIEHVDDLEAG